MRIDTVRETAFRAEPGSSEGRLEEAEYREKD